MLAFGRWRLVLLRPRDLAEVELAARDRAQGLALERVEMRHEPFVDALVEQQHLDAALAEDLEVRARPRRAESLGGDVVDVLLPLLHAAHIVGERDGGLLPVVVRG